MYTHNGSKLKLAFDLDIGNVYVKVNNNGCRKKELSSMDLDTTAKQKTFTWMDGQTADRTDRHHYFSDRVSLCILWKKGSAHCEQFVTKSKVRTFTHFTDIQTLRYHRISNKATRVSQTKCVEEGYVNNNEAHRQKLS